MLVEAVPRAGTAVLNADDPLVAAMARQCRGSVVYFSMQAAEGRGGLDRVDGHCGRGGAAMVLQQTPDGELVVLRNGDRTMPLSTRTSSPRRRRPRAMNVANALAAAAAAWAAGAHLHDIRQGLRTFSTSFFQAPGRLNEIEVNGYKVILDYCHNVDGMRRLTEFVDLLMRRRQRRVAPGAPGATARHRRHRHARRPARRRPPRVRPLRRSLLSMRWSCARTATGGGGTKADRQRLLVGASDAPARRRAAVSRSKRSIEEADAVDGRHGPGAARRPGGAVRG